MSKGLEKILEEQIELLSEHSHRTSDPQELALLSEQMANLARILAEP